MDIYKKELGYLNQALQEFEDYLLSDILYFPTNFRSELSTISSSVVTIGNVLLSLEILDEDVIPCDLSDVKLKILKGFSDIEKRWKVNWEHKGKQEFKSRLLLWENFILDLEDEKNDVVNEYISQVRHRVILTLMMNKSGNILPNQLNKLYGFDDVYIRLTEKTGFIWPKMIQQSFPEADFGFLYRKPI